jgi:hypothetical protein
MLAASQNNAAAFGNHCGEVRVACEIRRLEMERVRFA